MEKSVETELVALPLLKKDGGDILFYHTKVETVTTMVKRVNYLGEEKITQKFTQLHNKRTTFAGIVVPALTPGEVILAIGAATPNPGKKKTNVYDVFEKKIGRNISLGRALSKPICVLTCKQEETQERFLDACKKIVPFVPEFYIKNVDYVREFFNRNGERLFAPKIRSQEEIIFEIKQLI